MPKRARTLPTKTGAKGTKSSRSVKPAPAAPPRSAAPDMAAARERFISDLLIRGEAAKRDRKGKLPLRATHVIKKRKPGGSVEVERVRFKTF